VPKPIIGQPYLRRSCAPPCFSPQPGKTNTQEHKGLIHECHISEDKCRHGRARTKAGRGPGCASNLGTTLQQPKAEPRFFATLKQMNATRWQSKEWRRAEFQCTDTEEPLSGHSPNVVQLLTPEGLDRQPEEPYSLAEGLTQPKRGNWEVLRAKSSRLSLCNLGYKIRQVD
jgi:hypothetical protein